MDSSRVIGCALYFETCHGARDTMNLWLMERYVIAGIGAIIRAAGGTRRECPWGGFVRGCVYCVQRVECALNCISFV